MMGFGNIAGSLVSRAQLMMHHWGGRRRRSRQMADEKPRGVWRKMTPGTGGPASGTRVRRKGWRIRPRRGGDAESSDR